MKRLLFLVTVVLTVTALANGCGNQARRIQGPNSTSSGARVMVDNNQEPDAVKHLTNLCGHVWVEDCEHVRTPLANVKLHASWSGGSADTQTGPDGSYCFNDIEAPGITVNVCIDTSSLPPGLVQIFKQYGGNSGDCSTVFLQFPNNIGNVDFGYGQINCHPPCTVIGSINSGFNGTAVVGAGSGGPAYIWFNSNFSVHGGASGGGHVFLTNSRVFINGVPYNVPDATITLAAVACATTTFDQGASHWNTTVPLAGSDEIFLSGLAVPVDNLPGGAIVRWEGTFATDMPGACLSWKWGAAAYKSFTLLDPDPTHIDYNAAVIKPTHSGACGISNGDHAGTPQNSFVRQSVTGGARGGGGSNFTGSWSGTGSVCPKCP